MYNLYAVVCDVYSLWCILICYGSCVYLQAHYVYPLYTYIRIQDKASITEETHLTGINDILGDETQSLAIIKAAKSSMGMDTSESDMNNIIIFTERMISLAIYRKQLYSYLEDKMAIVAPNLSTLIGSYTLYIGVDMYISI